MSAVQSEAGLWAGVRAVGQDRRSFGCQESRSGVPAAAGRFCRIAGQFFENFLRSGNWRAGPGGVEVRISPVVDLRLHTPYEGDQQAVRSR